MSQRGTLIVLTTWYFKHSNNGRIQYTWGFSTKDLTLNHCLAVTIQMVS